MEGAYKLGFPGGKNNKTNPKPLKSHQNPNNSQVTQYLSQVGKHFCRHVDAHVNPVVIPCEEVKISHAALLYKI